MKCKARLVVRGDQQRRIEDEDIYAATLAGRSFRTIIALAARFDLEMKQYDAANAFVHADLDEEIFMKMPDGHRRPGRILRLQKALYGLRKSPRLWQRHFTTTLREIGFETVPHEPCCMRRDGIIIFFYVDDIVLAFRKSMQDEAEKTARQLQTRYTLTGGNDLQWFLGIAVVRDRKRKKIWLS